MPVPSLRAAVALVALALPLLLAGCSGLEGTGDANYVSGDGSIVQVAPAEREDPVELSGTTLDDEALDVTDLRGQVVVVPIWGSWCNPCRAEAPELREAAEHLDAAFVGINFRDESLDAARGFVREFELPYPSIVDDGAALLSLGRYAPRSAPATAVLDREGRVAALINGSVPSAGTLEDLVEEIAAEDG